jgi:hypothetical protein
MKKMSWLIFKGIIGDLIGQYFPFATGQKSEYGRRTNAGNNEFRYQHEDNNLSHKTCVGQKNKSSLFSRMFALWIHCQPRQTRLRINFSIPHRAPERV